MSNVELLKNLHREETLIQETLRINRLTKKSLVRQLAAADEDNNEVDSKATRRKLTALEDEMRITKMKRKAVRNRISEAREDDPEGYAEVFAKPEPKRRGRRPAAVTE